MTECYCFPPHNYTCYNCYEFYKEREMWRVLTVGNELLEETLNELEAKGCEIREVIPDGAYQFTIIFKEPQMLVEEEKV